ncbi:XRE family transcriptional regulator, partial [Clostridium perfringens]|nr:XRE family transcriptional regulator [Clostridium perfringens]
MIKEYRRINNISQTELAKKLGISKSFLSELEHC